MTGRVYGWPSRRRSVCCSKKYENRSSFQTLYGLPAAGSRIWDESSFTKKWKRLVPGGSPR